MIFLNPKFKIYTDRIFLAILFVVLLGQAFFFLAMGIALSKDAGLFSLAAAFSAVPSLICLGIVGAIVSIILLRRRVFRRFAITCLVISFVTANPYTVLPLTRTVSPALKPLGDFLRQRRIQQKIAKERSGGIQEADYKQLQVLLREPQEVVAVTRNLLLLKSGLVIKLFATAPNGSTEFEEYITKYVTDTLITTHTPTFIRVPEYNDFYNNYNPGRHEEFGFADKATGFFGDVPALVFIDGKLLNIKYNDIIYKIDGFQPWFGSENLPKYEQQGPFK